jgi:hypothetical protein
MMGHPAGAASGAAGTTESAPMPDYSIVHPAGRAAIYGATPVSVGDHLGADATWPAGRYRVAERLAATGSPSRRWGVAVKHPDGSVELIPGGKA